MSGKTLRISVWGIGFALAAISAGAYRIESHRDSPVPTVAIIPPSGDSLLWDIEHAGAALAAKKLNYRLYWNTPTSENDTSGQISLIDKVARGNYQGLVLTPNHTLAILAPVQRAIAADLPVVIVAAPLDLPAHKKLGYIINDDDKMGELAAAEIARLLHGKGSVSLIGLARTAPGIMLRVRAAERFFANRCPEIHVVSRQGGAYNASYAEDAINRAMDSQPELTGILSFTSASTRGAHAALKSRSARVKIRLVGCEQDSDLIGYVNSGEIAALLAENTYRMGFEAVELIAASLAGKPLPARSVVTPLLITRENLNSAQASLFTGLPR